MENPQPIERLEEDLVHRNPWWLVYYDRVTFPSGKEGRHLRLASTSQRPGAVALVLDNSAGSPLVALVRQWRYAQNSPMWELPRGFGEPGDPDAGFTAVREVLEETGLRASEVVHLGDVAQDSSIIEGSVGVYVLTVENSAGETAYEIDGEIDGFCWVTWDQLLGMIRAGEITDGFTLAALGLLQARGPDRN